MADIYAEQQQGVADGTATPPEKADGRVVGANKRSTFASKATDQALAVNDRFFLGYKPAGCNLVGVRATASATLGTTTIDIGDGVTVDRYVDGKTLTAVDTPTVLGPKASTLDDTPSDAQEEIWATILTANVAAATALTFELEFAGVS